MGVNAGRLHGFGARANQPTFSGYTDSFAFPGRSETLVSMGVLCQPLNPAPAALTIQDVGAGSTKVLLECVNQAGGAEFWIDGTGNAIMLGGEIGAGPSVFGPFIYFDGSSTSLPSIAVQNADASVNRFYIGTTAPSASSVHGKQFDWFYNSSATSAGNYFWACTVAGTPGTWVNFI